MPQPPTQHQEWVANRDFPPLAFEGSQPNRLLRELTGGRVQEESSPGQGRVELTTSCADCAELPKVADAGTIIEQDDERIQIMHNGVRVLAGGYLGHWMSEIIRRLRGHHEPQEEIAFHEVLQRLAPGSIMVELGANWSFYSLWFHKTIPGAVNWMLEPSPANLAIGRCNFALNGMDGQFVQAISGEASAEAVPFFCAETGETLPVRQLSIDDFMAEFNVPRIDLLHADIQGAEYDTLLGAAQSIRAGRIRFVFVSSHHYTISGDPLAHQRCLGWLKANGARILLEHTVSESFSGDGLIVASFDARDADFEPPHISRNIPRLGLWPETEYDLAEAQHKLRHQTVRAAVEQILRRLGRR